GPLHTTAYEVPGRFGAAARVPPQPPGGKDRNAQLQDGRASDEPNHPLKPRTLGPTRPPPDPDVLALARADCADVLREAFQSQFVHGRSSPCSRNGTDQI